MTRLPIATAAVCCGAAALTGCASGDADVGSRDSVADAAVMTSYAEVPEWVVAEECGVFEGYGFNGNLYCPGETYPEALPLDTTVEFVEGDLLFSFDVQATPPGVILQSPGRGWVVASFPTDGAATYRVRGDELDHDQFESYADDPSAVDTCWPPGQAPAPESPTPIPGPDGSPVEVPASVAEGWHGAGAGADQGGERGIHHVLRTGLHRPHPGRGTLRLLRRGRHRVSRGGRPRGGPRFPGGSRMGLGRPLAGDFRGRRDHRNGRCR